MSERTKKYHTKTKDDFIRIRYSGVVYQFPKKVAEKYRVSDKSVKADVVFEEITKQYSKPGALLRGIRERESLTQVAMAKRLKVTQSDISQMENGTRNIGRKIAKRIEKLFDVEYHLFLRY